ncbi:MAG: hypothetical protein OXP09_21110, partial [Gammaproteobacteria bacterium]|nr:hypothetical protein [Gammaproteobacteria bacterium]
GNRYQPQKLSVTGRPNAYILAVAFRIVAMLWASRLKGSEKPYRLSTTAQKTIKINELTDVCR